LESAVAGFSFSGNADEVCAQLKAALEARDARFNASLEAMFKPAPKRAEPDASPRSEPKAPGAQTAPATQARSSGSVQDTAGFSLSRRGDGSLRNSRLR
jgi:hypothetical protein